MCRSVLPVAESSCCSGQQTPSCLLIRTGKCEHVLVGAVKNRIEQRKKVRMMREMVNKLAFMQHFTGDG